MSPPSGTVTFLFTDIEGSAALWEDHPQAMRASLARHDELVRAAIESSNGYVFKTVGDAFCAAFATASDGLDAAIRAQLALIDAPWPVTGPLRIRAALHTGEAQERDSDYFGPALNRIARLQSVCRGGQIILSESTYQLVRDELPSGVTVVDLGILPLKDLRRPEKTYQLNHSRLSAHVPMAASADAAVRPEQALAKLAGPVIPQVFSEILGRDDEIEALSACLREPGTRLVTLVGAGGNGKTRLAIEIAHRWVSTLDGCVWFVNLTDVIDRQSITARVRNVLGLAPAPGCDALNQATEAIRDRPALLVLDNFEHLAETETDVVKLLIERAPRLKCLVTSRQILRLSMQHVWELAPLAVPSTRDLSSRRPSGAGCETNAAVRLFVDRARHVRSDFALTRDNTESVAEICRRLDGIPLAIELAAAWAKVLTPQQMLAKLANILVSRDRDRADRHHSLDAVIRASFDRLTTEQQAFLLRLAVFRGGWTVEAAEAVCDEPLAFALLAELQEASLTLCEPHGSVMRYRMLEPMRAFAESLAASDPRCSDLRSCHSAYYLGRAREAGAEFRGQDQVASLDVLEQDLPNLRAALEAADPDARLAAVAAIGPFWRMRGYLDEGRAWLAGAIAAVDSLSLPERAEVLLSSGIMAWTAGDLEAARADLRQSLSTFQNLNDDRGAARVLVNLANIAAQQRDYSVARREFEMGLEAARRSGDHYLLPIILKNLGTTCSQMSDVPAARACFEEALQLLEQSPKDILKADILHSIADACWGESDYRTALVHICECLEVLRRARHRSRVPSALCLLGIIWSALKADRESVRVFAAREHAINTGGLPVAASETETVQQCLAIARKNLSAEAFDRAWASGMDLPLDDLGARAVEDARAWLSRAESITEHISGSAESASVLGQERE